MTYFKVRKKGKTVGRRSKLDYKIDKVQFDAMIYGKGVKRVPWKI